MYYLGVFIGTLIIGFIIDIAVVSIMGAARQAKKMTSKLNKNKSLKDTLNEILSDLDKDESINKYDVYKKIRTKVVQIILDNPNDFFKDTRSSKEKIYTMIGMMAGRFYTNIPSGAFFDVKDEIGLMNIYKVITKKLYDDKLLSDEEFEKINKSLEKTIQEKKDNPMGQGDLADATLNNPFNPGNNL